MRTRSKLLLAGLTTALVLASAVSSASANNLSLNSTDWKLDWSGLSFTAAGTTTTCPVLLGGTFHENTITKTVGALIGHVTSASIYGACTGGDATVLTETLPWHVRFGGWEGELPFIEGVTLELIGAAFRVDPGIACLAATEVNEPGVGIGTVEFEGEITSLAADPSAQIDLDGGFLCEIAGDSSFSGTATVEDGESGELVLTLI